MTSLRDYFALKTLVLVFLRLLPLGRGIRGHPCSRFVNIQGRLCRFLSRGVPRCVGTWGNGWGSALLSRGAAALFKYPPEVTPDVITCDVWNSDAATFNFWTAKMFG